MEQLIAETKSSLIDCLGNAGVNNEKVLREFVTEKILSRPPFGFLHSLVRMLATSEKVMFASNLYSAQELDSCKKTRHEKVIAGEEVAATLHFLKVLARAASTERMIYASISASEKVLNSSVSDVYKATVRLRNSFTLMQPLVRERLARKNSCCNFDPLHSKHECTNQIMDELVDCGVLVVESKDTASTEPFTDPINDPDHEEKTKKTKPINSATTAPCGPFEHSPCCAEHEHNKSNSAALFRLTEEHATISTASTTEQPLIGNKISQDLVTLESQIQLDLERKRLFGLQHKFRQTLNKFHEREDLLRNREATLEEKERRANRLSEHLKKQQAQIVQQIKKQHEVLKFAKKGSDEDGAKFTENIEIKNLHLKEREERISRLEKKLQKLQSRLLKKQQEQDFSIALSQSSAEVTWPGGAASHNAIPTILPEHTAVKCNQTRYCCQSIQTDREVASTPLNKKTKSSIVPKFSDIEPFLFCDDTQVLYTHATKNVADASKLPAFLRSKGRPSKRKHRIIFRRIQADKVDSAIQSNVEIEKKSARVDSSERKNETNLILERSADGEQKERKPEPSLGIPKGDDGLSSSINNIYIDQPGGLSSSAPAATMSRDVASVATKSEAASLYRGYKFSFDVGACKEQKVYAVRNSMKFTRVHDAAVCSSSQRLTNFDQQIQGALNNM